MSTKPVESFSARLHDLLAETEKLLDSGTSRAGDVQDAATDALHRARKHLHAAYDEVSGKAREIDRAVHDNPWRAIAATGLIAFLLGMLVRRR